jgi:glyoxylase-like metal-dependent hydrolase (beta-lactamase superfamily II)
MSTVFELHLVSGGSLRLDGGAMFGVVPKPVWEKAAPPDEKNRIELQTNCLLVRAHGKNILIDTGYGGKAPAKVREQYALEPGEPLLASLGALGHTREDIDIVVLTHLHFDHAGGGTRFDGNGNVEPTFPNAKYFVQQAEWEDAAAQRPELVNSYFRKDFLPLEERGQLELLDGNSEIVPGVHTLVVGGHTRGMQLVSVELGGRNAMFMADLCPTSKHLPTFWTMSYDQFLLDVRRVKPSVLQWAANEKVVAIFEHDPTLQAATLKLNEKGVVVVDEPIPFPLLWED